MERKFKPLFDLTVKHAYYTSGHANDFVFSPTQQTAKDFGRYKLSAKLKHGVAGQTEAYGLTMRYTEVDGDPLIPITATDNPSLVFGMNLKNTRFLNITENVASMADREVLHYTNVGASTVFGIMSLIGSSLFLRRKVFELNFNLDGADKDNATIRILDASETELPLYTKTLSNDDGNYQALIDLNGLDDGIYFVQVEDGANDEAIFNKYFISDELTAMNPLAILDLKLTNNTSLESTQLIIKFSPRSVQWKYWVVLPETAVSNDYEIISTAAAPSLGTVTFGAITPAVDSLDERTLLSLQSQYIGRPIKLFQSSDPIDLIEAPIMNIRLRKNPSTILVKHLPGMPVDSSKTEAYIFI